MKTLNKAQIEGLGESLQPLGRTARIFKLQGALMPLVEEAINTVFKAAQDEYGKTGDISPERDAQRIELIRVTALMIATQVFDAPAAVEVRDNQTSKIMKTQHTPGPWAFGQEDDERMIYNVLNEALTMRVLVSGENPRANARLIAAAPELLEASQQAKTIIYNLWNGLEHRGERDLQAIFDKVIQKVTDEHS